MSPDFTTKAHAKWILAGEHAVLRSHPALVFPIPSKFIELFYWDDNSSKSLEVDFNVPHGETFLVLFWGVFEEGLKLLNKKHHDIQGRLFFQNNIPMGAGMGFSAAFCTSLTKLFQWKKWLNDEEAFEFARLLENHFHGKSSGVDIAGSLYDGGIYFTMGGERRPIALKWRPHLYLSHCGHVSVTSKCVNLVGEMWEENKSNAEKIDQHMANSVELAYAALQDEESVGLPKLQQAMKLACQCFTDWKLINHDMEKHFSVLQEHGAIAFKPTGAGDGGYVLSLWKTIPDLPFEMVAVF
jgi:mevalonate kinase